MIGRDDPAEHRSEQRQQCDEVVTQPVPQEQDDHAAQDGKGDDLVATHCAVLEASSVSAARRVIIPTRRPPASSTGICSMRCSAMRSATLSAVSSSVQVKSEEDITCDTGRGGRIETGSDQTDQDVANRQHPDDAVLDPDEDDPAIDIGDRPRGVLHAVLGCNERHIPQHQLGNPHSLDLSNAA